MRRKITIDLETRREKLKARIPDFDKHMLLSELDVAAMTGIPRGTLSHWRCSGVGPAFVKLEGAVRYSLGDIIAYVEERRQLPVKLPADRYRKS